MKQSDFILVKLIFFILMIWPSITNSQQSWQMDERVSLKYSQQIEGENYYNIITNNPTLTGEISFDEGGKNLIFKLIRNGNVLWEKPAPSDYAIIPEKADLVIMVNYLEGEGIIKEGRVIYSGLSAYNSEGKYLGKIETGPMSKLLTTEDGKVLFVSDGILSLAEFSGGAKVLWSTQIPANEIYLFKGTNYASTGRWVPESNDYKSSLVELTTGNVLTSVTGPFNTSPFFFAVSHDEKNVFLRRNISNSPPVCDIEIFEIGKWNSPVRKLESLNGGPFTADLNPNDGTLALGILKPSKSGQLSIVVNMYDQDGTTIYSHDFQTGFMSWQRAYIRFNEENNILKLLFDLKEYQFYKSN